MPTRPASVAPLRSPDRSEWVALFLMGVALLLALVLHLLVALLAGLAAFGLLRAMQRVLQRRFTLRVARWMAVAAMVLLVIGVFFAVARLAEWSFASAAGGGLPRLLQLGADTLDQLRQSLPPWITDALPAILTVDLREAASNWLRSHAAAIGTAGHHTLSAIVHALVGFAIGVMAGASHPRPAPPRGFIAAWMVRLQRLDQAFSDIVLAQLRIAGINTLLTTVYLLVALPLAGQKMPLAPTLIGLTFAMGMLPVVGNLVSNTAIVVMALTQSPWLGLVSLGFLVAIHKLEYFLNARIVGGRIQVRAVELLAAMLVMEAAFGIQGLVAAPIYYAWLSAELRGHGLLG